MKTYALSVLYEIEGIEKNRGTDEKKCEEKEAEGRIFLRTIAGHAASDSLHAVARERLDAPYKDMNTEDARRVMVEAYGAYLDELKGRF